VADDGPGFFVGINILSQLEEGPNQNKWFSLFANGKIGYGQPSIDAGKTCTDYSEGLYFNEIQHVGYSKTTQKWSNIAYVTDSNKLY
jgi:hypothetical protein